MIILEQGQVLDSFDTFAIDNVAGTVFALPAQAVLVTWQTSFGSAPVAVNIIIETSLDNVSWSTVATTTATGGATGSFTTSAVFIRASIVSHTGGDTVTVQLVSKNVSLVANSGASVDSEVLFNSGGKITGSTDLEWDDTNKVLTTANIVLDGDGVGDYDGNAATLAIDSIGSQIVIKRPADAANAHVSLIEVRSDYSLVITPDEGTTGFSLAWNTTATPDPRWETNAPFFAANLILGTAGALKSDTTNAHTMLRQVYDVDGAAYKTIDTATNDNSPTYVLSNTDGVAVTIQATTYKSSDGSTGATGSATAVNTLTIKNGLVTNIA